MCGPRSSLRQWSVAAEHDPARLHDKGRGDNTELDAIALIPRIKWGQEVVRTMVGLQDFDDPNRYKRKPRP